MNLAKMHIGVDIGKESLDVCYPDGTKEHIKNNKSDRAKIIKKAIELNAIVCFEATGGYEDALVQGCLEKGVDAQRLNPWGARKFAESQGLLEKTDSIDCEMIRDYAASLKPSKVRFVKLRSEAEKRLREVTNAINIHKRHRSMLVNQAEHLSKDIFDKSISPIIQNHDREIERLEKKCEEIIESEERLNSLYERFQEVKGVGPSTARTILACCPDIGEFTSHGIAKFCGNAPLEHKSGTICMKSRPRRGRSDLKQALYMAALSASRYNHIFRELYTRLVEKGKPRKVALMAVARRLGILLNTIAKYPDFKPQQDSTKKEKSRNLAM